MKRHRLLMSSSVLVFLVVFVLLSEFEAAAADGDMTIGELSALESLVTGTTSFYQEQNHIFGIHPVSHYSLISSGMLDDGRSCDVFSVERNLRFLQTRIRLDSL